MSQATYKTAIEFVAKWEGWRDNGGYTNDPKDPGGETKWGISKRAHPNEDIKNLTLERAMEIYRKEYWDIYKAKTPSVDLDAIAPECAIVVFDAGVNCGVNRSHYWYNQSVKQKDPTKMMLGLREQHYLGLKNDRFIKGWLARLNDLKKLVAIIQQDAATSLFVQTPFGPLRRP